MHDNFFPAPGEFRVSAIVQPPDAGDGVSLVWDSIPGEGLVIHNVYYARCYLC